VRFGVRLLRLLLPLLRELRLLVAAAAAAAAMLVRMLLMPAGQLAVSRLPFEFKAGCPLGSSRDLPSGPSCSGLPLVGETSIFPVFSSIRLPVGTTTSGEKI
jgi:hypothetical protein